MNIVNNNLRTKEKWENMWAYVKLPTVTKPAYDIQRKFETFLPKTAAGFSLIEIGCAPGSWMAYFNRQFGCQVSGIEYAEIAASITRKNLDMQGVQAEIFVQDFLSWGFEPRKYEVAFSAGFIEHFRDMAPVMERICSLSNRFVVTIVPNLYGINGVIRKLFSPKNFTEHIPIDVSTLEALHAHCGMRKLFCDYVGGVEFVPPGAGSRFFREFYREHRNCARIIYGPVSMFNRLSMNLARILKHTPNSRMFSNTLMYIGEKAKG